MSDAPALGPEKIEHHDHGPAVAVAYDQNRETAIAVYRHLFGGVVLLQWRKGPAQWVADSYSIRIHGSQVSTLRSALGGRNPVELAPPTSGEEPIAELIRRFGDTYLVDRWLLVPPSALGAWRTALQQAASRFRELEVRRTDNVEEPPIAQVIHGEDGEPNLFVKKMGRWLRITDEGPERVTVSRRQVGRLLTYLQSWMREGGQPSQSKPGGESLIVLEFWGGRLELSKATGRDHLILEVQQHTPLGKGVSEVVGLAATELDRPSARGLLSEILQWLCGDPTYDDLTLPEQVGWLAQTLPDPWGSRVRAAARQLQELHAAFELEPPGDRETNPVRALARRFAEGAEHPPQGPGAPERLVVIGRDTLLAWAAVLHDHEAALVEGGPVLPKPPQRSPQRRSELLEQLAEHLEAFNPDWARVVQNTAIVLRGEIKDLEDPGGPAHFVDDRLCELMEAFDDDSPWQHVLERIGELYEKQADVVDDLEVARGRLAILEEENDRLRTSLALHAVPDAEPPEGQESKPPSPVPTGPVTNYVSVGPPRGRLLSDHLEQLWNASRCNDDDDNPVIGIAGRPWEPVLRAALAVVCTAEQRNESRLEIGPRTGLQTVEPQLRAMAELGEPVVMSAESVRRLADELAIQMRLSERALEQATKIHEGLRLLAESIPEGKEPS